MKNLSNHFRVGLLTTAIATSIFGSAVISRAESSETEGSPELLEEFSIVEFEQDIVLIDDRPSKVMFYDAQNNLKMEATEKEFDNGEVQKLLRKSDLLFEFDGVKYYYTNQ